VHFNKTYQAATWRHFQQLGRPSMLDHPGAAPVVYDFHALAFFCKMEVKLEKAVSFPIKFRLGDVQYVDRMEGKIDY
jgi:hypothetical protein